MDPLNQVRDPMLLESIINFAGMIGLVGMILLSIVLVFKMERLRTLNAELAKLRRAFEELDEQAKLIVRTDLELHRAQEELDKKVAGLVTLQKLTRLLTTTLDEEEIFHKLDERNICELGYDRALGFTRDGQGSFLVRIAIGYAPAEAQALAGEFTGQPMIVDKVLGKSNVFASSDSDRTAQEIPRLLKALGLSSFVCAPIPQKDGAIGALVLGYESPYTHLTDSDKDLVYVLAAQIGQALENAKLFEEQWRAQQDLENKIQQRTRELTAALQEIKAISKRKSDFISAVSHELRTPLTSIKGYASIVAAGKLGELPPAAKERIEKINKHSDNLSSLINNLLDIARIESGREVLKFEAVNLKALADNLADMLAPPMKDKGIEFSIQIPPEVPLVRADRNQIDRVFINIVGNAIKFTPPGGRITVAARLQDPQTVEIKVSDTGIGIAPNDLEKIFEEFYRVDNEVNQSAKGTGLGLTLVKYIVEAHHGKLSVSSQVGHGSHFIFTLPKA